MSKMLKVVGASWLQTKISSYILGVLGVLAILAVFVGQIERIQEDGTYAATVFYTEKTGYRIEYWGQSNDLSEIPRGVARAYFRMDIDSIGWSILEIETYGAYRDDIQAYAAGIVEGALTWYLIHTHLDNTFRAKCEERPLEKQCDKLRDTLDKSANVWKSYATEHEKNDPFWHQVSLYYTQINGIFTGWKHGVERSQNEYDTDISDLYWLNAVAEITEIQRKLNVTVQDTFIDDLPNPSSAFLSIVKETAKNGDALKKLYIAHNSAGSYTTMMKIIKRYKLNYRLTSSQDSPQVPGSSVEFTSYPGSITSQDEFYLLKGNDHKLAVTGTTLRNYKNKLWKNVNITEQLPVGPRITAANHLSSNVSTWGHNIASSNSGTGCKQWLVVDLKKFDNFCKEESNCDASNTRNKTKISKRDIVTEMVIGGKSKDIKHTVVHRVGNESQSKGLVWIIEQIPSRTHSADISDVLIERSYYVTHGIPVFKDIQNVTYTTKMEETYGNIFSEQLSPRALTFKMGYKNATTLESIIKLMRQNNLTAKILANGTSCGKNNLTCYVEKGYLTAIGARWDLIKDFNVAFGVQDTKVISNTADKVKLFLTAGPPYTVDLSSMNNTINKGNLVPVYTNQFDHQSNIDGVEIRDLVKQQREEEFEEYLDNREKEVIEPFEWSDSAFSDTEHEGLPDKWAFTPYKANWHWLFK